ncbi:MAG: multidrug ABC transporter ATP-binding protein [Clostridiales bacterium GWB2_37_7]|nr:MAG: multidrug ABC transporter ATP-binding protein [Clostridiales bacterium GWB2_37_7]
MKAFTRISEFLKQHKWQYIIGIIVLLIVDGLQLIPPRIIGIITDGLTDDTITMKSIYIYSGLVILIACFIAALRYVWRMCVMGAARDLEFWLRNKFFAHLETLSPSFYNNNKTGDLMAHATNDISALRMAFGPGVVMVTDAIFIPATTITIMLFTTDIRLTLLALLPLPFIAILMGVFGKVIQKRHKDVQAAFSDLTDTVQENMAGIRVVKSFVQEKYEIDKFLKSNNNYINQNMRLVKVFGFMFPLVTFIASLSFIIVLGYGGALVIRDEISLGQFTSFIAYLGLLTWPMMAIGYVVNVLQRGTASMKRLNVIFDIKPEIIDEMKVKDITQEDLIPSIEFKNLSFTYPDALQPALANINLKVEAGKTLAILGRTGSGKTTLVNLILRMYNTEEGQLAIGDHDINTIPLKTLRESIGYVPQDNFLFSTTIRDNIAFSNMNMDIEKIEQATRFAHVHDNIMEFPLKFDTILGERGVTLSGGQKQRVSIARAIAKDPRILILDDSLSAVDTKTEEKILNGLKQVMKNRTSIIIAHRISTLKEADEIIVLDEGKIIEKGTHEELIILDGLYNSIYQKQLLEEKLEKEA